MTSMRQNEWLENPVKGLASCRVIEVVTVSASLNITSCHALTATRSLWNLRPWTGNPNPESLLKPIHQPSGKLLKNHRKFAKQRYCMLPCVDGGARDMPVDNVLIDQHMLDSSLIELFVKLCCMIACRDVSASIPCRQVLQKSLKIPAGIILKIFGGAWWLQREPSSTSQSGLLPAGSFRTMGCSLAAAAERSSARHDLWLSSLLSLGSLKRVAFLTRRDSRFLGSFAAKDGGPV